MGRALISNQPLQFILVIKLRVQKETFCAFLSSPLSLFLFLFFSKLKIEYDIFLTYFMQCWMEKERRY